MSSYEVLLWLHVTCAVLWVGGGVMIAILGAMVSRANDEVEAGYLIRRIAQIGPRFLAPLSGITGLLGILLVVTQDAFTFGAIWIDVALVLWLASSIVGAAYLTPHAEKIVEAIKETGRVTPDIRPMVDRVLLVVRIDSAVLVLIVALMTLKPGA